MAIEEGGRLKTLADKLVKMYFSKQKIHVMCNIFCNTPDFNNV